MAENIVVSSDHEGFDLKHHVKTILETFGYTVTDVGTFSREPVDYPLFTYQAARKVASGECARGIIFCGTGQGDAMTANKVPGIRAALCWDTFTARYSRAHNDANILVLGAWLTGHRLAEEIISVWLNTPFDGGRHLRRLQEITAIEREMMTGRGQIYDLSPCVQPGMAVWPGDRVTEMAVASPAGINRLTGLSLSAHAGSHADAPVHMLADGEGADRLDLEAMLGAARMCQLPGLKCIDRALLDSLSLAGVRRLVIGTGRPAAPGEGFQEDYCYLTGDAADYLVEIGLKLLAIDSLSVDRFDTIDYPVHRTLLAHHIVIVEGITAAGVPAGDYELLCLPLKIKDGDAAPARVVLRELL